MPPQSERDLIDPRPDERFDQARLAAFLRGRLPGADETMTVRQFGGGKANLTYELRFGAEHEYVLRRPPLGPVAPRAHDMNREYRVLSVLPNAFPFAPRAYLYCDDENLIGAPFVIMQRCHGTVIRDTMPGHFQQDAQAPRKLSEALIDALAAFHAVDYDALGLGNLGKPEGFIRRQVDGWWRRWGRAKLDDNHNPQVDQIYRWLEDHLPASSQASLVHNDYKLDNTMFASDDTARVVAILDWDMCTLGDPLSDVGALLTYWSEPDDPPYLKSIATMPTGAHNFLTRRQLLERYAIKSGRDLSDMQFYHVLGIFRLLVILQQIYIRYVRGQTEDQRFATLDKSVAVLAQWALAVMGSDYH